MQENPRIIFEGPAGTGKTVLAIEAAKRSCSEGKKVLFLCYNKLLGQYLEKITASTKPELTVSTIHKYMLNVAEITPPVQNLSSNSFWYEDLPKYAINKLLYNDSGLNQYDEIIVDETQDILRNNYLDILDLSLKGGLSEGKWKFFGDFEQQSIYGFNTEMSITDVCNNRLVNYTRYSLRINCRNTPRIASLVHLLSKLNPDYTRVLRPDNGVEPEIIYYDSNDEQLKVLNNVIIKIKNEKYRNRDIVILSINPPNGYIKYKLRNDFGIYLSDLKETRGESIKFGSIYSFKGLESPIVIVTGIQSIFGKQEPFLLYVAMTRALYRLYILAHTNVKSEILKKITQG